MKRINKYDIKHQSSINHYFVSSVMFEDDTQYLGYYAQLSRLYVSHITLIFILLLWKVISFFLQLQADLDHLYIIIQNTCSKLEDEVQEIVNFPTKAATEFNKILDVLINTLIERLLSLMASAIELMGDFIVFLISIYRATLQCLVIAVVDGVIAIIKDQAANIQKGLQQGLDGTTNGLNKGLKDLTDFFEKPFDPLIFKPVDVPQIPKVVIPDTLTTTLQSINFNASTVLDSFENLIKLPFNIAADQARQLIPFLKFNITIIQNMPQAPKLFFCMEQHPEIYLDILKKVVNDAFVFSIVLLIILFLISIFIRFLWFRREFYQFRNLIYPFYTKMGGIFDVAAAEEKSFYFYQHSKTALTTSVLFNKKSQRFKWIVLYLWHLPSILIFIIGLNTLIFTGVQTYAVNKANSLLPELNQTITKFSLQLEKDITDKVIESVGIAINKTNQAISTVEQDINSNVFEKISDFYQKFNVTVTDVKDKILTFLEQDLKLSAIAPILNDLADCVVKILVMRLFSIVKFIGEWRISLPRVPEKWLYDVATAPVRKTSHFILSFLLGKDQYHSGIIQLLIDKWKQRIEQEVKFGIVTVALGFVVLVQGITVFFFL